METFTHDPNAVLDYSIDWSDWLEGGDTIVNSTWVMPNGITQTSVSFTTTRTTVWLTGGTPGERYKITNRIGTSMGRTDDRSIYIAVKNR